VLGLLLAHVGVGDIALGACVMAMPIVERPSCLTCPSVREALVLLILIPWLVYSRFVDDLETVDYHKETCSSTLSIFPNCSSHILVKMLPFSSAIAQFFMVLQGW